MNEIILMNDILKKELNKFIILITLTKFINLFKKTNIIIIIIIIQDRV